MAHQPTRPFESLEWYRDAARRNFQESAPSDIVAFLRGTRFLRAHVGVFALGAVLLLLVNFMRTPETLWSTRWIVAWAVLVLIHGVAIGFVWAIGQWDSEDPGEPVRMAPLPNRERSALNPWAQGEDAVRDAAFRHPGETGDGVPPSSDWEGWTAESDSQDPEPGERTSWRVASAAAWLQHDKPTTEETPSKPDPT